MNAKDLEDIWEAHARYDPLWAILSDPTKKDRGWEIDRFFASGEREVRFLLRNLSSAGIDVSRGDALDFGCGIGRLTQALSHHFERVVGIDIAPTMIALAEELNPRPERVRFVRNPRDDLAVLGSAEFDFIYSNIVLQHVPPELTKKYLLELLRALRPGGILVFQLPSHHRPSSELTVRAMPDDAYRAALHVDEWPRVAAPAARVGLAVRVDNTSPQAWHPSALGQINLANHWLAQDGTLERQDDARAGLPHVVKPGEQAEILIAVTTPDREGSYSCELDLVHETITWFKDRGSPTCQLPIEVTATGVVEPARPPAPARSEKAPWVEAWDRAQAHLPSPFREPAPFPMFGIPREEALVFLARHDVPVLSVDDDGHAGWDWIGYRYTVRKPS